jgi:hypothetical protein
VRRLALGHVDNTQLRQSGYRLRYPDFADSMRELGARHRQEART